MGALYTIESKSGRPTLADAAAKLSVAETDLDSKFGVVLIDPTRNLYAVEAAATGNDPAKAAAAAPYSNPQIEGFGPPRRD